MRRLTSLYFKCLPNKALASKTEPCFDGRQSKQRKTVLMAEKLVRYEKD